LVLALFKPAKLTLPVPRQFCMNALAPHAAHNLAFVFIETLHHITPLRAAVSSSGFSERSFAAPAKTTALKRFVSTFTTTPVSVADEKTSSTPTPRNCFFSLFSLFSTPWGRMPLLHTHAPTPPPNKKYSPISSSNQTCLRKGGFSARPPPDARSTCPVQDDGNRASAREVPRGLRPPAGSRDARRAESRRREHRRGNRAEGRRSPRR